MAQEVESQFPELVKELKQKNADLEARIDKLEKIEINKQ